MINHFYALPIWEMILIMLIGVLVWEIVGRVCTGRCGFGREAAGACRLSWGYINCGLALIWIVFILYMTLYGRTTEARELILIPFYSFVEAREQPEMYRSMLANIMLFVPLGVFVSNGIGVRMSGTCGGRMRSADDGQLPSTDVGHMADKRRVIISTVLIGLLLSLCVESVQYIFALGRAEIDDVITNTIGTAIGGMCYHIVNKK